MSRARSAVLSCLQKNETVSNILDLGEGRGGGGGGTNIFFFSHGFIYVYISEPDIVSVLVLKPYQMSNIFFLFV